MFEHYITVSEKSNYEFLHNLVNAIEITWFSTDLLMQ